jgi:hypothetical protein
MRILDKTHIQLESSAFAYSKKLFVPLLCLFIASCSSGSDAPVTPLGNDASLSSLTISGVTLDPEFSTSVTEYTTSVPFSTANVDVTVAANDNNASVMINGGTTTNVTLTVGEYSIAILVTAEDGTTTRTYTVVVTRAGPSSDASLSSLSISDQTLFPDFDPSDTVYQTESFDYGTSNVVVDVTASDAGGSVTIVGETIDLASVGHATANVPINFGPNRVDIVVTAEDGTTTRTYTVGIFRSWGPDGVIVPPEPPLGSDVSLSALWVDDGHLDRATIIHMTVLRTGVRTGTTDTVVSATASDVGASLTIVVGTNRVTSIGNAMTIVPITVGQNRVDIVVTAIDGTTTRTYTIDIYRSPSRNAYLSGLEIGGTVFSCLYRCNNRYAPLIVSSGTTSVNVNATLDDELANVTINGGPDTNVPLAVGENTIVIVVTAEDGTTTQTYEIIITRVSADNANLGSLELPTATWDPPFDPNQFDYTLTVGFFSKNLQLIPTAEDADATISVNGSAVTSGTSSDPIALTEGSNLLTVNVTSADGTVERTYTVVANLQSALVFAQAAYLKASNTGEGDGFGRSVSLSGDGLTLAVGAPGEDSAATGVNGDEIDNSEGGAGAVYVFARNSDGRWVLQAYVKGDEDLLWCANTPDCFDIGDSFGASIALSRDGATLAVGAHMEDGFYYGDHLWFDGPTGAVYVFTRDDNGVWTQQRVIKPSTDGGPYQQFGKSVVLSDDGATLAAGISKPGGVYLFIRDSGLWTQQSLIPYQLVALSGDGETLAARSSEGVNLLARDGDLWTQQSLIELPDVGKIALSGDGATLAAHSRGDVYLFDSDGDLWTQRAYVTGPDNLDNFALSNDGATLAVGASWEDSAATGVDGDETDNTATDSCAVYLFSRDSAGHWNTRTYVKASNTDAGDRFGAGIALSADGTMLAVGANLEDSAAIFDNGDEMDNNAPDSGAVYIFNLENTPEIQ